MRELTGRNTLDTSTTSETSDGWLCDTLDVITENLSMSLGSTLSETLATFSAWKDVLVYCTWERAEEAQRGVHGERGGENLRPVMVKGR